MTTFHGGQCIEGRWTRSGGKPFQATNPATGEALPGEFVSASEADIAAAFHAASAATLRIHELGAARRADFLDAVADELMALGDAWLERANTETALPKSPRLEGERVRTCGQLRLFAALLRDGSWLDARIDTAQPDRKPLPRPDIRSQLEPLGPVVVFDASNFPLAFGACGNDMASAIAAGCPVIVKSHTLHPGTNELAATAVLKAIERTGMPSGIFALLQGSGREVGSALVKHPHAAAVGFTGSEAGGRALFDLAAARPRPIPVYAEMGSLNPLIILPEAQQERLDALVTGLAQSLLLGAGQFCTKPGLIFVQECSVTNQFIEKLAAALGTGAASPLLAKSMADDLNRLVQQFASSEGVTAVVSGKRDGFAAHSPTLFSVSSETWRKNPNLRCEAFGPFGLIVRIKDAEDLLKTLDLIEGTLTATLHHGSTDASKTLETLTRKLASCAGRVIFNGYPTGVEVCHAMMHGGPYPATTNSLFTSVGSQAIERFARPVCYQNIPDALLPEALRSANPLDLLRLVDGVKTRDPLDS